MITLISTANNRFLFHFEKMNCLAEKDIKSFELIFFDHSIDTGENDVFSFYIYPNRQSLEIKQEFKNIEALLKFMKTISKKWVKDNVNIIITKSVLKDADFTYLWRNKLWNKIIFVGCLFQNVIKKI